MADLLYALMALPGFVFGFIAATILLIKVPKLYTKLRCQRCSKYNRRLLREKQDTQTEHQSADCRRSNQYSEIDEKKTRTFSPPNRAVPRQKANVNAEPTNGKGYEKCIVGTKKHRYSNIDVKSKSKSKQHDTSTTNSYEPFSPGPLDNNQEKRVSYHDYFILEPGSDKRLPVKLLDRKPETLPVDAGHVYFKLEPGTSKVTPMFQNVTSNETSSSSDTEDEQGHIYFVLEPMVESAESETLAYAVNDVATSSAFFILEKAERSA